MSDRLVKEMREEADMCERRWAAEQAQRLLRAGANKIVQLERQLRNTEEKLQGYTQGFKIK